MPQTVQTARVLRPLTARRGGTIRGRIAVPGDKSVSHRALLLGAMAVGETTIRGLLEADDIARTVDAMRHLGADVQRGQDGLWRINGVGVGGFREPQVALDFGNSGTGCRLTMGAVATTPISTRFDGDDSLRRRPMVRVLEPLSLFGSEARTENGRLPIELHGAREPVPVTHEMKVPSAQVKSAMLLAALNVPGRTTVIERTPTRDHTEQMLREFGADVHIDGANITVIGETELRATCVNVPGDPSSAAFPLVAALIVPGSQLTIENVMIDARRNGLIETLKEMGAYIAFRNDKRNDAPAAVQTSVTITASALKGVEVPPERAPSMIDEYPILAIAAAFAEGRTVMHGIEELRTKESDRLAATAHGLRSCGVGAIETRDSLIVDGRGADGVRGGAVIATNMDHRIAMSFLVLGLAASDPVTVDDASMIVTSFPDFVPLMRSLGADLT